MKRLLAASFALLAASAAAQGITRWADENGRMVQHAGKAAAASGPVVLYATSWCRYCAQARAYFAKNGIAYIEHDVEKSASANAEFKRLGGKGVPLIVHAGQTMRGFSEQGFESLLARTRR